LHQIFQIHTRLARQHLIQDGTELIDVAALVHRVAAQLLGRHIDQGANLKPGVRHAVAAHCQWHVGDAEVGQLGPAILGKQDVGRPDIAMDDAAGMGSCEAGADVGGDPHGLVNGQWATVPQPCAQVPASQVFRHDVTMLILVLNRKERDNVGMAQASRRSCIAQELVEGCLVCPPIDRKFFDGCQPVRCRIMGQVNEAVTSPSEKAIDVILQKLLSGSQWHKTRSLR